LNMIHIILKPLTCAAVLAILLEAGCGGTINLTKQGAGGGSGSMLSGGSGSMLSGGSGSMLSGGSGSMTAAGAGNSGAGGRGTDASPVTGGAGNRGGAPAITAGASADACRKDGDPCGGGGDTTCVVQNADPSNCGTCGKACSSGELCFAGVCASPPAACGTDSALAARLPLASGKWPRAIAIGDWNGDGMTDFAVANSTDGTVSVFLGCGGGTFAPRADYVVTTMQATIDQSPRVELTSCDVNADGKADLITAGYADHAVTVLLGVGDGTFVIRGTSAFTSTGALACADLSGDGRADVAVCNAYAVSVLQSVGDGTLNGRIDFTLKNYLSGVGIGDLNEDGKADLVAGTAVSVAPLLGNGDGTFTKLPEQENLAYYTVDLAIADLNGDGHLDLGVGDQEPRGGPQGGLGIVPGKGDGTFAELVQLPPAVDIYGVATGDVNGDGRPDLVGRTQSGVRVLFGTVGGGVALESGLGIAGIGYSAAGELGDMDGDGKLDMLTTKSSDNQVYLILGNGDGTFRP